MYTLPHQKEACSVSVNFGELCNSWQSLLWLPHILAFKLGRIWHKPRSAVRRLLFLQPAIKTWFTDCNLQIPSANCDLLCPKTKLATIACILSYHLRCSISIKLYYMVPEWLSFHNASFNIYSDAESRYIDAGPDFKYSPKDSPESVEFDAIFTLAGEAPLLENPPGKQILILPKKAL